MNTAACLVVDSPDFSDESRGAPQLTAVLPMTELIKVLPNSNLPTFTATVVSEDAGSDLLTSLLIDYGVAAGNGAPWQASVVGPLVEAKTVLDGPRDIQITWSPGQIAPGCHTVTMLVTHQRKNAGTDFLCPSDANDFDTLTWVVSLCEEVGNDIVCNFDDCAVKGEQEYTYCETVGPLSSGGSQ